MKLEEQFKKAYVADSFTKQYENYIEIADNHAILFANWCFKYDKKHPKHTLTTKELLEIYKETL